ncbi:MAG: hypothetical protein LBF41_01050, partial [Deltaproteobacteria bacterium]|nr:hypothetical protein [Deltaproteobacteria bacterium]
ARALLDKALPEEDPALLAALIAGLTDENPGPWQYPANFLPARLRETVAAFKKSIKKLVSALKKHEFAVPDYSFQGSLAVYEWATTGDFDRATEIFGKGVGDLVRLVLMTVEHLSQFGSLVEECPTLGQTARIARNLLIKEPIT